MKKLLTILTITAIVFASCSKTKKLSKRLATKWNITKKDHQAFYNNVQDVPQTYTTTSAVGSVELKSDGTGTFTDPVNAKGDLAVYTIADWYNDDAHVSILVEDQSSPKKVYQWTFNITTNEKEKQVWFNELNREQNGPVKVLTNYYLAIAK